jgi:hypothetical protein
MVRRTRSNNDIKEAFIPSSTDEIHHSRNEFPYVDKVALSTNKFYMIEWLNPFPGKPSKIDRFMYSNLREVPSKLTYLEKAFTSYLEHCWAHRQVNSAIRCLYLMKAMTKVLNGGSSCGYVDMLDRNLADTFEVQAYLQQLESKYTPQDLKQELMEYLRRENGMRFVKINEEDYRRLKTREGNTIYLVDGEFRYNLSNWARMLIGSLHAPLYNVMKVNSYSQFLSDVLIPHLEQSIRIDKDEALSEFIFGIIAAFEDILPMIYFVTNFDNMKNRRVGYCYLKGLASSKGCIPIDLMVVPAQEVTAIFHKATSAARRDKDLYDFLLNSQYVSIKYYSYLFRIRQIWREIVSDECPSTCSLERVSECPLQRKLYRKIRSFLLSDKKKSNDMFVKRKIRRYFPSITVLNSNSEFSELSLQPRPHKPD